MDISSHSINWNFYSFTTFKKTIVNFTNIIIFAKTLPCSMMNNQFVIGVEFAANVDFNIACNKINPNKIVADFSYDSPLMIGLYFNISINHFSKKQQLPGPVEMIGVNDSFGESGTPAQLMGKYGLNAQSIVNKVRMAISRKN